MAIYETFCLTYARCRYLASQILHNVASRRSRIPLLAVTSGHFTALGMLIALLPVRGSKGSPSVDQSMAVDVMLFRGTSSHDQAVDGGLDDGSKREFIEEQHKRLEALREQLLGSERQTFAKLATAAVNRFSACDRARLPAHPVAVHRAAPGRS